MNTSLFDMKDTIENAPEPVRFLWEAMHLSFEVNAAWGTLKEFKDEYGDAKPYFIISDKQETIDWCRENGVWLFDVVDNPVPKPFTDRKLVAYDVDSTLSNNSARSHYVQGHGKGAKKNWAAFNAGMSKDTVNQEVAFFFNLLKKRSDVDTIILTARDGEFLGVTENWLAKHGLVGYNRIYIREKGSFRKDSIEKKMLLEQIREDFGKLPDIVFDDRNQVTKMMREEAKIYTFNVNQSGEEY